jgi:hypothetical protein
LKEKKDELARRRRKKTAVDYNQVLTGITRIKAAQDKAERQRRLGTTRQSCEARSKCDAGQSDYSVLA